MKLNKKLFNKLVGEPVVTHVYEDGLKAEIYFMNEEQENYYDNQRIYSVWSGVGPHFKCLINKSYYEYNEISKFYEKEAARIWIDAVINDYHTNRKINLGMNIPMIVLYIVAAVLFMVFLPNYAVYGIIGFLILFFIVFYISGGLTKKKRDEELEKYSEKLIQVLGIDLYNQLAEDQHQYRVTREKELNEEAGIQLEENIDEEIQEVKEITEEELEEIQEERVSKNEEDSDEIKGEEKQDDE